LGEFNVFTLTTPYTITNAPLIIGYTVTFNLTAAGNRFATPFEQTAAPYPEGGYNARYSATAESPGAGATWSQNTGRAALIFGHVTGTPLANDLCAVSMASPAIKMINTSAAYGVWVYNAGTVSQNNFPVQLLDASNNVLATQTVTTAVPAGGYRLVNINYTPTTAGLMTVKGRVNLSGDQVPSNNESITMTQRVFTETPMTYSGGLSIDNGIGPTTPPSSGSAAISYTTATVAPFVGKNLTAIDFAIAGGSVSNGTVWIRNSTTGANLYSQPFTPVNGWNFITLNTPFPITSQNTFIGYSIDIANGNPLGVCNAVTQVAGVNHIAIGTTWYNLSQVTTTGNNAIIGVAETPANVVTITTAVNPAGAGTVTGGGPYTIGNPVTLTASANTGYTFTNWTPGGSTANPLTFNATVNATYTANFTVNQFRRLQPRTKL
jgi:hypothetical protein